MTGRRDTERTGAPARRAGILLKLVVAFAVPATLLFAGFAVVAHEVAARELETELGKRLVAVAAAAAGQIRNADLLAELRPSDDVEEDIAYKRARRDLEQIGAATRVGHLYLFDRRYRSVADTDPSVAFGAEYYQAKLDRVELEKMFANGGTVASVLFEGVDGRLYKAAYAPVLGEDGAVLLAVGVDAPADFFARLEPLRRNLFLIGAALLVLLIVVALLVANRITRPLRELKEAAESIGRGALDQPIAIAARDEVGVLVDTMERMRRDLRARDERNQMMLAGIAHEVRNPLGGIELFAGILRDEIDSDDERRDHVERIARELEYLKRVVEDFLEYARRPPPELEKLDLAEVATEVVALASADAARAEVNLEPKLESAVVRGDEGQLRRALLNLVSNAVQASRDGSTPVVVETGVSDGKAFVGVKNQGTPIPEDVREKMFQPFYTSKEKGTGLGLAFVKEIVDDHGGDIVVVSGDSGTEFRFVMDRLQG